ncbi:MAG: hypothetical protein AAB597_00085 [Patescibacteria group bacterium]
MLTKNSMLKSMRLPGGRERHHFAELGSGYRPHHFGGPESTPQHTQPSSTPSTSTNKAKEEKDWAYGWIEPEGYYGWKPCS